MTKNSSIATLLGGTLIAVVAIYFAAGSMISPVVEAAPTQTAQSVMISVAPDDTAYEIEGTVTWTFNRGTHNEAGTAMTYYGFTLTSGPTFTGCTGGATNCATANAPAGAAIAALSAPNLVKVQQLAHGDRCEFFSGGTLSSDAYAASGQVKGANGSGNWNYSWSYSISPIGANDVDPDTAGVQVAPYTAWSPVETGGAVDIGFSGFIVSESFQKQGTRNKYSFTALENGLTRIRNVTAQLQVSDGNNGWTNVGDPVSLDNTDTDGDLTDDGVSIVPAGADFSYSGNGGIFGNSAVFGALHATGKKSANGVYNILNGISDGSSPDNFAGNNNDLAAGNVHTAPFAGVFLGITEPGTYRVQISGVIKGNAGGLDFGFSVTSAQTVSGGC